MTFSRIGRAVWCVWLLTVPAWAEVGDPTVQTDHPQYAGEGAFQTIEDLGDKTRSPQSSTAARRSRSPTDVNQLVRRQLGKLHPQR